MLVDLGPGLLAWLAVLVGAGVVIAWLNHRVHLAQAAHRAAVAESSARMERLDAILNTSIDGIIVIDARGRIESFNPGASTGMIDLGEALGASIQGVRHAATVVLLDEGVFSSPEQQ